MTIFYIKADLFVLYLDGVEGDLHDLFRTIEDDGGAVLGAHVARVARPLSVVQV